MEHGQVGEGLDALEPGAVIGHDDLQRGLRG
jgi:hypothetical protein